MFLLIISGRSVSLFREAVVTTISCVEVEFVLLESDLVQCDIVSLDHLICYDLLSLIFLL